MRKLLLSLCALLPLAGGAVAAKRLILSSSFLRQLNPLPEAVRLRQGCAEYRGSGQDGLTLNHFSNSPVCSVARSTWPPHSAPRWLQYRKSAMANLPKGYHPWSALRKAGYYAANNSKTDYNFVNNMKELWDESSRNASWRKRKGSLFYMQSGTITREFAPFFAAGFRKRKDKA